MGDTATVMLTCTNCPAQFFGLAHWKSPLCETCWSGPIVKCIDCPKEFGARGYTGSNPRCPEHRKERTTRRARRGNGAPDEDGWQTARKK